MTGVETAKLTRVWSGKCFRYTDGTNIWIRPCWPYAFENRLNATAVICTAGWCSMQKFLRHIPNDLRKLLWFVFDAQMWLHMIPRTIFWLGKMFCSCRCRYDAYEFVCLIQMVFLQRFLQLFFCLLYVCHVTFWHIFTYMAWKCSHDQCNCTAIIVLSRFVLDWLQTHSCQQRGKLRRHWLWEEFLTESTVMDTAQIEMKCNKFP